MLQFVNYSHLHYFQMHMLKAYCSCVLRLHHSCHCKFWLKDLSTLATTLYFGVCLSHTSPTQHQLCGRWPALFAAIVHAESQHLYSVLYWFILLTTGLQTLHLSASGSGMRVA